jgi:DNA modification methylase
MLECGDNSIDLIITSPPYNISTRYGALTDDLPLTYYIRLLHNVITECHRVLNNNGTLVIDVADSITTNGKYIQLANLVQNICIKSGLHLVERSINFIKSKSGVILQDHSDDSMFASESNSHSNCHHVLVFSKKKRAFSSTGQITYINYVDSKSHPCPFPKRFIARYYKKFSQIHPITVLDPFMGTAKLGRHFWKYGNNFIGYELDTSIYQIALKQFTQ